MRTVGILVHCPPDRPPGDPEAMPIGRAALAAEAAGIRVVVGDDLRDGALTGSRAVAGGWAPATARIDAAYDRFPSRTRPAAFDALLLALGDTPLGNPPALTRLCRDKVACQRRLEAAGVEMPALASDPSRFDAFRAAAGDVFAKPRHGSFGLGVSLVRAGQPLPEAPDDDAVILQRAVPPPAGWASVCVRLLAQRTAAGWVLTPAVARRDRRDPVANVARTSEVAPFATDALRETALAVCAALDDPLALELGLDFAIDDRGHPWLIEVNGRPRGRLERLAALWPDRFAQAHAEALLRPIATLAEL